MPKQDLTLFKLNLNNFIDEANPPRPPKYSDKGQDRRMAASAINKARNPPSYLGQYNDDQANDDINYTRSNINIGRRIRGSSEDPQINRALDKVSNKIVDKRIQKMNKDYPQGKLKPTSPKVNLGGHGNSEVGAPTVDDLRLIKTHNAIKAVRHFRRDHNMTNPDLVNARLGSVRGIGTADLQTGQIIIDRHDHSTKHGSVGQERLNTVAHELGHLVDRQHKLNFTSRTTPTGSRSLGDEIGAEVSASRSAIRLGKEFKIPVNKNSLKDSLRTYGWKPKKEK